jgi:hypothetical protein
MSIQPSASPATKLIQPEIVDGIDISEFPEDIKATFRAKFRMPLFEAPKARRSKTDVHESFKSHALSSWEVVELHNSPLGHVDEDGKPCPIKWAKHLKTCKEQFDSRKLNLRKKGLETRAESIAELLLYSGIEFKTEDNFVSEFSI